MKFREIFADKSELRNKDGVMGGVSSGGRKDFPLFYIRFGNRNASEEGKKALVSKRNISSIR